LTILFIQNDCLEFEEKAVKDAKGKKVKKKQAVLRMRKSIGQGRGSGQPGNTDDGSEQVKAEPGEEPSHPRKGKAPTNELHIIVKNEQEMACG